MKQLKIINIAAIVITSSFLLTACGSDSADDTSFDAGSDITSVDGSAADTDESIDKETNDEINPETDSDTATDTDVTSSGLSSNEVEGLLFMREEEELARDLYLDIYAATGSRLNVFKNISGNAETQHAEAMRVLLETYDIDDPSTGEHNTYTSVELQNLYDQLFNIAIGSDDLAALRVGAFVEEADIEDINIQKSLVSLEHEDIISTYENLLCGSRNHLRSFVKQIEKITGTTYVTQVPALDSEVRAILSSDKEQCGQ